MKWYESPYLLVALIVVLLLFITLTGSTLCLALIVPPLMLLLIYVIQQPQILTAPVAVVHNARATRLNQRNNISEAIRLYTRAIDRNPHFTQPLNNRGLLYMESGRYDEALADFNAALKLNESLGNAFAGRGKIHEIRGDIPAAMADWDRAEQLNAPMLFLLRGDYNLRVGKHLDALRDFEQAVRLNPSNAVAHNNAAYLNSLVGDVNQALKYSRVALEKEPAIAGFYGTRGHIEYQRKDYQAALSNFLKAIELKRDYPFGLAGQAVAYYAIGSHREARRVWDYLLEAFPQYEDVYTLQRVYGVIGPFFEDAQRVSALAPQEEADA